MSVAIYDSLDIAIDWGAYKSDDRSYVASLKGTRIEPKYMYIWDAVNDAHAPIGWNRSDGFQLRVKLAIDAEMVRPPAAVHNSAPSLIADIHFSAITRCSKKRSHLYSSP